MISILQKLKNSRKDAKARRYRKESLMVLCREKVNQFIAIHFVRNQGFPLLLIVVERLMKSIHFVKIRFFACPLRLCDFA
jgi:hypothetical protein